MVSPYHIDPYVVHDTTQVPQSLLNLDVNFPCGWKLSKLDENPTGW